MKPIFFPDVYVHSICRQSIEYVSSINKTILIRTIYDGPKPWVQIVYMNPYLNYSPAYSQNENVLEIKDYRAGLKGGPPGTRNLINYLKNFHFKHKIGLLGALLIVLWIELWTMKLGKSFFVIYYGVQCAMYRFTLMNNMYNTGFVCSII